MCSPKVQPLPKALTEAALLSTCCTDGGLSVRVVEDGRLSTVNEMLKGHQPRIVIFIGHADVPSPYDTPMKRTLGLTDDGGSLFLMEPETVVNLLGGAEQSLQSCSC